MGIKKLIKFIYRIVIMIVIMILPRRFFYSGRVLFWGAPILSAKYIIHALRSKGIDAVSNVTRPYLINKSNDFDFIDLNFFNELKLGISSEFILIYFDSFNRYGAIVGRLICILLKFKGCKLIVMPYGSDSFLFSKITDLVLRNALIHSYPSLGNDESQIQSWLKFLTSKSSFIVGCMGHLSHLSRWDILPVHYYPIDIEKTKNIHVYKYKILTIAHSPNHKFVKGTDILIQAIKELNDEGFECKINLLENMNNDEVIIELAKSHILVEQLIIGSYALSAIEGMASKLPVISYISSENEELFGRYSYLSECPIIRTHRSVESLKKSIRFAASKQTEIGDRSFEYVNKYHSYTANAKMWIDIFEAIRNKRRLNEYFYIKA